jgi:hypothetical protein
MKTLLNLSFFGLLLVILITSINCDGGEAPDKNLDESSVKYYIDIKETHLYNKQTEGPKITLSLVTKEIFSCCNYTIKYLKEQKGNIIDIVITGLNIPGVCLTACGPAASSDDLDLKNGEYRINIICDYIKDAYDVKVTEEFIEINWSRLQFTEPRTELFRRFPKNSFVYLCGTTIENKWICKDFLDSLSARVNIKEFNFPEYGKKPYPDSSQGYYYNMPARFFKYENESDFAKINEALKSYSKIVKKYSGVGIELTNWKNEKYCSWLY